MLAVGAPVELRGPVGGWFVWHAADPAPVLLVAGGSGIAPLMAMVRDRAAQGSGVPFRLVYSVRTHRTCTSPTSCADAAATTAA